MTGSLRRRASQTALGALAIALTTAPAAAQVKAAITLARAPEKTARAIGVTIAGETEASSVEDVLRERIESAAPPEKGSPKFETSFERTAALDPRKILTPAEPKTDQLARIWVDLTDKEQIALYIVDGEWERVLARKVQRTANPEIAWEELGHIVELAIVALAAGETIGVARRDLMPAAAPAPSAPPPTIAPAKTREEPPPIPAPRATLRARGGVFYVGRAYADGPELMTGPGAEFALTRRARRFSYGGVVMGEFHLPSTVTTSNATVRLVGGALHALASGGLALGRSSALELDVGAGIELVRAEVLSEGGPTIRPASTQTDAVPTGRALVRYSLATALLHLFVGAGVDVPMMSIRYTLASPSTGSTDVLFDPWSMRPFGLVGIATP